MTAYFLIYDNLQFLERKLEKNLCSYLFYYLMEQSSQLRGQDLVRWLGNRFGDSNEWKANIASSVLTSEILSELETCFQELDSPVKLKMIQVIPILYIFNFNIS